MVNDAKTTQFINKGKIKIGYFFIDFNVSQIIKKEFFTQLKKAIRFKLIIYYIN